MHAYPCISHHQPRVVPIYSVKLHGGGQFASKLGRQPLELLLLKNLYSQTIKGIVVNTQLSFASLANHWLFRTSQQRKAAMCIYISDARSVTLVLHSNNRIRAHVFIQLRCEVKSFAG